MLPWQPLRIDIVVGYTFDLLSEAIFYLLRTFFDGCHGNIMLPWQPYKFTVLCDRDGQSPVHHRCIGL